jgi:hypothetical protein
VHYVIREHLGGANNLYKLNKFQMSILTGEFDILLCAFDTFQISATMAEFYTFQIVAMKSATRNHHSNIRFCGQAYSDGTAGISGHPRDVTTKTTKVECSMLHPWE